MVKRDRARPKLLHARNNDGYDDALASRTSRKRENKYANGGAAAAAMHSQRYAPPTTRNNFETIQPAAIAEGTASPQQQQGHGRQYGAVVSSDGLVAPTTQQQLPHQRAPSRAVALDQAVAAISPRSDCNVDGDVSVRGERPPARVFFPNARAAVGGGHHPLPMDDSVTIDSELEDPSEMQSRAVSPMSPAVYHLARDEGVRKPSPRHRAKLDAWYQRKGKDGGSTSKRSARGEVGGGGGGGSVRRVGLGRFSSSRDDDREYHADMSRSLSTDADESHYTGFSQDGISTIGTGEYPESVLSKEVMSSDEDYLKTKQEIALLSISLTSVQLLIICLQFAMCGIAPFDVNPFVGPFPDAFSEWGGKNPYIMLNNREYWRIITPSGLSVGILHLLANAFCQLEPIAIFEREWGSFRWLLIYLLSAVGCNTLSVYMDPDSIAVGSSGSLMGLFAAKVAQVLIHTLFEVDKKSQDEFIRLDQLSSVVCGLIIISLFSFLTYIDWSGHLGGLMAGFFAGMVLFSNPIRSCCVRFLWTFLGLTGLTVSLTGSVYLALTETEPSEDLADPCYYFRNLYPEDQECGCFA